MAVPEAELLTLVDRFTSRPVATGVDARTEHSVAPLPFMTGREFAAMTPAETAWVAEPWVPLAGITELSGKIKQSGKTTFATFLSKAVTNGTDFLGHSTLGGPVVYLTEQPASSLRTALHRAGLLDQDNFHFLRFAQAIGVPWPDVVAAAIAQARSVGAVLLVVDTLPQWAGLRGEAENDSGAAMEAMAPLQGAAEECGVLVLRHDRKSGGEVGDSARGSTAYGGTSDVLLQLARPEGQGRSTIRVLNALSRYDETPDKLLIELTDAGYVDLGTDQAVAAAEAREAVLRVAPTSGGDALTEKELYEAAGVKRTTGQGAIREHLATGRLRQIGEGKRGSPYKYWRHQDGAGEKHSAGASVPPAENNQGQRRGTSERSAQATPRAEAPTATDGRTPAAPKGLEVPAESEGIHPSAGTDAADDHGVAASIPVGGPGTVCAETSKPLGAEMNETEDVEMEVIEL